MREGSGGLAPPAPPTSSPCGFGQALFGCFGQYDAHAPPAADSQEDEISALRGELRELRLLNERLQGSEGGRPATASAPYGQAAPAEHSQEQQPFYGTQGNIEQNFTQNSPTIVGQPLGFTSKEIDAMKTDLDPDYLPGWFGFLVERVGSKMRDAAKLLQFDEGELLMVKNDPKYGVYWGKIDSELSTLIVSLIDGSKPHAKIFYATASAVPGVLASGNAIIRLIMSATVPQTSAEYEEREEKLSGNNYFQLGMTALEAAQASAKFRRDWSSTSAARGGQKNDLISRLINQFPAEMKLEATMYRTKLNESEITGVPLPWTFEQLSGILAAGLRKYSKPKPTEVAAAEMPAKSCLACGKLGHIASFCPTVCETEGCRQRACPGNYGGKCVVTDAAPIPAIVKNAKGWPLPGDLRCRLVAAHEKYHAKGASLKETFNVEAGDPDAIFFPSWWDRKDDCGGEVSHAAVGNSAADSDSPRPNASPTAVDLWADFGVSQGLQVGA